jgi:hypothetical protein
MAEVDPALRQAKEQIERELLNYPGVTGVDIGYKEVGGQRTDQLAIRVLVKKKRADVRPEERVPETIGGFPTDVIERRYELQMLAVDAELLMLQADAQQYDPLKGGISVGPCRPVGGTVLSGTLGLIVTDNATGKPMLLSNFHVLCGDRTWTVGDAVAQPGRVDQGTCPAATVGALQRAVLDDKVDCAVADVTARASTTEIVDIGVVRGMNTVTIGDPVRKRGRSTGLTYGFVDGLDLTIIVPYPGIGEVTLTNQIGVRPDTTKNPKFSASGDSGSAVVNAAGEVVGLHFAGNPADGHGAANPIASVVAALNVSVPVPSTSPGEPPQEPPKEGPPPSPKKVKPPGLQPYPPRWPPPWQPPKQPPVLRRFPPRPPDMSYWPHCNGGSP